MAWKEFRIEEIAEITSSKRIFFSDYVPEGVPFYRSKEIIEKFKGNDISTELFISREQFISIRAKFGAPQKGDILLTSVGTIGTPYLVKEDEEFYFKDGNLTWFRRFSAFCNSTFVFYWLQSSKGQEAINGSLIGSSQAALTIDSIKKIKIKLPPLSIQRRIAEILGRYDALIDNYQRQISILEALAQSLYREWFVRGRCPFVPTQADDLPIGWEEKSLGEIATDTRRIVKVQSLHPDMPYVGLEHLSVKSIVIKNWGTADEVDSDKLAFKKNEILFGKIRPYLHKVCLSHFEGVCSSDTIVIRPTIENALAFLMFTVFDEKFIDYADKISNGTKMPRAEWSVLQTYPVVIPVEDVLAAFEKLVLPIFSKMENLQIQITKLQQMRDKLLPRLMSGQIPLEVAE
jgi:type I restriction enzyme, S subunit